MSIEREQFCVIKKRLFKGKAIILVGPRQVGKTTLLRQLMQTMQEKKLLFLNCDEPDILRLLENVTSTTRMFMPILIFGELMHNRRLIILKNVMGNGLFLNLNGTKEKYPKSPIRLLLPIRNISTK